MSNKPSSHYILKRCMGCWSTRMMLGPHLLARNFAIPESKRRQVLKEGLDAFADVD